MNELAQPLPHSVEAERSVLGAILLDPNAALEAFSRVASEDFFITQNRVVYHHMQKIVAQGSPIDPVSLIESLKSSGAIDAAGGYAYISSLPDGLPRLTNVAFYAQTIADKAQQRTLIHWAENLQARAFDAQAPQDLIEKGIAELLGIASNQTECVRAHGWDEVAKSVVEQLVNAKASPEEFARMRFGLSALDSATFGLRRTELVVLVAPTSNGKTLLASQLAAQASADGFKTLYFSAEMTAEQIVQRELAYRAGVKFWRTQRPEMLSTEELEKMQTIARQPLMISIVDQDITPSRVWAMSEAAKRIRGLDLVIVDYDQLVIEAGLDPKSEDDSIFRHQRAFVLQAKRLAERLDVCIVMLCQLRKVAATASRGVAPRLDDVWGDSSVRNTPHLILWLVRDYFVHDMDPDYERKATVHILKSRNGRTGHVELEFDPDYLRFRDKTGFESVQVP